MIIRWISDVPSKILAMAAVSAVQRPAIMSQALESASRRSRGPASSQPGKGVDSGVKAGCRTMNAKFSAKGRTMASDRGPRGGPPVTPVTAMGVGHIRLSYLYLDRGDIDGYLSLLHADISLSLPGEGEIRGREPVGAFQACPERLGAGHLIHHMIASGDRVAVEGRYVSGDTGQGVDFTDVFALSEEGLLRSQRRYYFVAPRLWPAKS
jgi:hypothetical protein